MNKPIPTKMYVLTDVPKLKPITKHNFYSVDIRPFSPHRNTLYSFESKEALEYLLPKGSPYYINQVDTAHLIRYCKLSKTNLHTVSRCYCTIDGQKAEAEIRPVYDFVAGVVDV